MICQSLLKLEVLNPTHEKNPVWELIISKKKSNNQTWIIYLFKLSILLKKLFIIDSKPAAKKRLILNVLNNQ